MFLQKSDEWSENPAHQLNGYKYHHHFAKLLVQQQASNTSLDYHQSHVEIHLPKHEQPPSSAQLSNESIFACHNMQSKQPNCINKFCLSQHAIKETQLYQFFLVTTCNQRNPICIPKDSEDPLLNLLGRIAILKSFKKIRVSFVAISLSLSLSL